MDRKPVGPPVTVPPSTLTSALAWHLHFLLHDEKKLIIQSLPEATGFTLEELIAAPPEKLDAIARKYENDDNFQWIAKLYTKFANKGTKPYNAYDLAGNLDVSVCPYCNRNYIFTVDKRVEKITRPDFDHFYPKESYPILALSFYNLIPSCAICNRTLKGKARFNTREYLHPYRESLDDKARFRLKLKDATFYHRSDGFSLRLEPLPGEDEEKTRNSIEAFKLDDLYDRHKDLALEMIQKAATYDDAYLDDLLRRYEGTLFKNREDLLRHIFGAYVGEGELHKRPLSKLVRDMARELGMLT